MRPAWRGAPAALRLPGWLTPSLLLLLLLRLLWCPHAARGDCGDPPDIPNATVETVNRTTFPVGFLLGYYCNKGFMKIFGKVNAVHCLENGEWSKPEVFCQRSCGSTPRLIYGHKQDIYIPVSYHPAGFIVVYECNPGYARNHSVSANVTCLQNYTWSKPEVFCYKRSCPDPGKIENGHISIPNGTLFASFIYFSCNPGNSYNYSETHHNGCSRYQSPVSSSATYHSRCSSYKVPVSSSKTNHCKCSRGDHHCIWTYCWCYNNCYYNNNQNFRELWKIRKLVMPQKYDLLVNDKRAHIYDIDSFAYDAGSHWLPKLAKEEIRRKCIQVHRIS
ncbi:complement decay-accelerating factor isoform X12 [Eptesicus fuscus]|uniref:complement decay-accelerating factor isoform X12 n=1 Tax=Eptesicus fuscus TaxID=29078 RepID=UPI002404876F|nr:complement decay-accelerating factor isoform X12 [Eptesicus fuscus]